MEKSKSNILPVKSKVNLPMSYPSGKIKLPSSGTVLAADVGGTKTNLALFQIEKGKLVSLKNQRYPTSDHQSFVKAIRQFHDDKVSQIDCALSLIHI